MKKGVLFALSAAICFAIMGLLVQSLKGVQSPSEITFVRGLFGLIILFPFVRKEVPTLVTKESMFIWCRSFFGASAVLLYFTNIHLGGSSDAKLFQNLSPIFVLLFSISFLKERYSLKSFLYLFLSVFFIFIIKLENKSDLSNMTIAVGVTSAILTAFAYMSLKRAANKYSAKLIVFQFSFILMIVSPFFPGEKSTLDFHNFPFHIKNLAIPALALVGQICLTKSHLILKGSVASAFTLSTFIFLLIGEILFFSKTLPFQSFCFYLMAVVSLTKFTWEMKRSSGSELAPFLESDPRPDK